LKGRLRKCRRVLKRFWEREHLRNPERARGGKLGKALGKRSKIGEENARGGDAGPWKDRRKKKEKCC